MAVNIINNAINDSGKLIESIDSIAVTEGFRTSTSWEDGCKRIIQSMPEDLRPLARSWLLKAVPEQEPYIHVILGQGSNEISNHFSGNFEIPVLRISNPTEFFTFLKNITPRISGIKTRGLPMLLHQDIAPDNYVGLVVSSAIQNATPEELDDPIPCIERFIEHLETAEQQPYSPDTFEEKANFVGYAEFGKQRLSLMCSIRPAFWGYETPTTMDFSLLPPNATEIITAYNKAVGRIAYTSSYPYSLELTPSLLTIPFGLHKVRFGLTHNGPSYIYAVQNLPRESSIEQLWPNNLLEGLLAAKETITSREKRLQSLALGNTDPFYTKLRAEYETTLNLLEPAIDGIRDLAKQRENLDSLLYAVDEGLPKVTKEERAFKKANQQNGEGEGFLWDPESTRHVPRAGYTALVCAIASLHKAGIREIRIPTFMPVRWYAHVLEYETQDGIAPVRHPDRIQYATTNYLTRMGVRAAQQIDGAEIWSYPDLDHMLVIKLGDELGCKTNKAIASILGTVKQTKARLL